VLVCQNAQTFVIAATFWTVPLIERAQQNVIYQTFLQLLLPSSFREWVPVQAAIYGKRKNVYSVYHSHFDGSVNEIAGRFLETKSIHFFLLSLVVDLFDIAHKV
jgi:hypothetical protein